MRARSGQSSLTLVALLCAQCASGHRELFVARRTSVPNAAPRSPIAARERGATPTLQWIPSVFSAGDGVLIPAAPGDSDAALAHVLVSSVRATLDGTNVQIASQRPIEDFATATRTPDGWLFLTRRGRVFFSQRFLGALRPVDVPRFSYGGSESTVLDTSPSHGALAWIDAVDRAWVATERGASSIDIGPARAIAFASPSHAGLVMRDGRLLALDGSRWIPLDLQGLAASDVSANEGKLVVRTSGGLRELRPDRTLAAIVHSVEPQLSHEQQFALVRAITARWPRALASVHESGTLRSKPAVAVGRDLVRFDGESGALLSVHHDVLPSARCVLDEWGEHVALTCSESNIDALFSPTRGLIESPFAGVEGRVLLSDDGLHALSREPCASAVDRARARTEQGLCAWGPWGRWRTHPRWSAIDQLIAVRGATALVTGRSSVVAVFDLDRQSVEPIGAESSASPEPVAVSGAIGADASIALLAQRADQPAEVTLIAHGARRRLDAPLPEMPFASIALVDEHRLLVSDTTAETVRYFDAPANEWRPLVVPVEAAAEQLGSTPSAPVAWACASDGCRSERAWVGYGPAPMDDVVIFDGVATQPQEFPDEPVLGAQRPTCWSEAPVRGAEPGEELTHWGRDRIVATVEPTGVHLELWWSTDDAPSRRMRASGTVPLRATRYATDMAPNAGWRVAMGTERFALIERCVSGGQRRVCERWIATASAGLRPLDGLERYSHTAVALRREDGAVALFAEGVLFDQFVTYALLDRDGSLRLQSATSLGRNYTRVAPLAIRGTQVGFIAVDGARGDLRARFRVVFDGDRRAAPSLEARVTPSVYAEPLWCRGPSERGAITALVSRSTNDTTDSAEVWRFEAGEAWCARRWTEERSVGFSAPLSPSASERRAFGSQSAEARGSSSARGLGLFGAVQQSVRCGPLQ